MMTLRTETITWRDTDFLFSLRISSYQANNIKAPCLIIAACCLFELMSSKSLGQLRNNDDLLFRLKLKFTFLNSCKSTLFQNFKKMVAHEFLIRGVQQLENMFSIARKDLYSWLNIVCLGVNDLSRYDVSRSMTVSNLANSC